MKLRRMMNAGLPGLANRGWQEVWRSLDRAAITAVPNRGWPVRRLEHLTPPVIAGRGGAPPVATATGIPAASPRALRRARVGQFFAGAEETAVPELLRANMPAFCDRIIATADGIRNGRFNLMGYRVELREADFDWHRDAMSGRRSPLTHWSKIDPLDRDSVGDSKVIWELSRHQWFLDLGQAYRFTGDERYAATFASAVRSWMRENPPGIGLNWASSLEVAYRLISWCWALHLFSGSPSLEDRLRADLLGWIRTHAAHVEKYLSFYFSPNTHLTGESLGLVYAGVLFPDLPKARRWRRTGARVLLQQLPRQVYPDGVYFEQSTWYARYTVEIYLHFMILAARNGMRIPAVAKQRVCRMLDHLLAMRRPDGSMPQVGDCDGGRLLPIGARDPEDCSELFALAAALFRRADYAWAAGGMAPEVAWLLGTRGCREFERLHPEPPHRCASQIFSKGGYAIMRNGWKPDAHQLVMDIGPLGCPLSSGHGHADLLSIQCSSFGRARLLDPGTFCYTADPAWRNHFRNTQAHNTVVIDGIGQADPAGPFAWHARPVVKLSRWRCNESLDYVDAQHRAYRRLPDPVVHRRRVLFVKPHYWIVADDLYGTDTHRFEVLFHFADPVSFDNGWARSVAPNGRGLHLHAAASVDLAVDLQEAEFDPIRGWQSPNYGVLAPAPCLRYSAEAALPQRIVTLLIPDDRGRRAPPMVTMGRECREIYLDFEEGRDSVIIDDREVVVKRADGTTIAPLSAKQA